jgi:NAD(P)-dependent dehydrogenase (short-subunit alcohol dehydrogenase family)
MSLSTMASDSKQIHNRFLGTLRDCTPTTDPRQNKELGTRLKDKNVVIAGGGRGVGRASAEFFAHTEISSLSIMALELSEVDETAEICRKINPNLSIKTAGFNVLDYAAVEKFVQEVIDKLGTIDVLFVNAGRAPQWLPLHESDPIIWWETLAVSTQGSFHFSRAALPHMRKQPNGGRIIFTSSAGAHAPSGMSGYVIGKLGQVRLAEIIHNENKDCGVKAFAYHPGAIPTRFFHDFKDVTTGTAKSNTYLNSSDRAGEQKSAETAVKALESTTFATPQMPAGLVVTIAGGQLDHMSGRYLDASRRVEEYIEDRERIVKQDLHRVRLVVDKSTDWFLPRGEDTMDSKL